VARAAQQAEADDFRRYHVQRFVLHPGQWLSYSPPAAGLQWTGIKFGATNAKLIPKHKNGLYTFVAEPGIASHPSCHYLMYVGMVRDQGFYKRYRQYLNEENVPKRREHVVELILKWPDHLWFYYAEITDVKSIPKCEDDLIAAYLPPVNKEFPARVRRPMKKIFGV
jgi:hypothetical protein